MLYPKFQRWFSESDGILDVDYSDEYSRYEDDSNDDKK